MKKNLLTLLLVGTMATMMVACGSKDADDTTTPEANVEDTVFNGEDDVEADTEADVETEADDSEATADLGTAFDVLEAIYATADLNADLKGQIDNGAFQQAELDESLEPMFLGTAAVDYVTGAVSAPQMSSIAYQVVILQVEEGQDVEAVKTELLNTADPMKWVCVEPESVVAESNGNYVLFIMSETATADALITAFQAL